MVALSNSSQSTLFFFLFAVLTIDWFINLVSLRKEVMTQVLTLLREEDGGAREGVQGGSWLEGRARRGETMEEMRL